MCTEIDFLPHIMVITDNEFILPNHFDRRNSSTPSVTSSSSSTTTTTTQPTNNSSWFDRKLLSHFKRLFRHNSPSSKTNSTQSSRRGSINGEDVVASSSSDEQSKQTKEIEEEVEEQKAEQVKPQVELEKIKDQENRISISNTTNEQNSSIENDGNTVDLLYDYDRLLARCLERQKHDLNEMITRCKTPITIPHADLIVGHSRSILVNWKSYVRLFRALNRDPQLFQQYVNHYYGCQSSINQHEQLMFSVRTTKTTFDNVLKLFLNEYVTCLACQKAQTHLIKSTGLWRIECQLCGSQRSVKRLKWKL